MSETDGFYLSRQPIVAGERRLVGWELLFGTSAGEPLKPTEEQSESYLAAVLDFANSASWDSLLGGGRALLQVDRRLIFSDAIEHMPRNRMLLGISPTETIDANLSNRLYDLHSRRGSRLLFIDYCRRDPREQLLELADAVQIDAFDLDEETRGLLVRRAQRRKLQILATSVEKDSDFIRIRESGFDLLQGHSYSEASYNEETQANPEGKLLLQLLVDARGEFEIDQVTQHVEANPALAEGLLRLVNSLELARAQKIESVGQALILIGAKGLSRWLNLLLFQIGSRNGNRSPLFRVAASRARLMELVSLAGGENDSAAKGRGEAAFLVGILSLVHVLLGVDSSAAIAGLTLPHEITQALSKFEGDLGRMLRLAVCLDRGEFAEVAEVAAELSIDAETLWGYQRESYDWVMQMG
jgi:EAL and modified HD-GYP domain-containing signal transduction protein